MKRPLKIFAVLALFALAGTAVLTVLPDARSANPVAGQRAAAEQRVTFAVENMTCALCPITVRNAMAKVEGVKAVSVDFDAKTGTAVATVVFDPALATPEQIGAASTNAGYPASPLS